MSRSQRSARGADSLRAAVLDCARRLLELRQADKYDNRSWVTSAEIAAELGEPRTVVVEILRMSADEGALATRSTQLGVELEVTDVRVLDPGPTST